jgi:hypothetical protein
MRILDLDLDFFLNDIAHECNVWSNNRIEEGYFIPWSETDVIKFLEDHCGLKRSKKTSGRLFTFHHEVFNFLRDYNLFSNSETKFDIDHIDAHSDLGFTDSSSLLICTDLLAKKPEERYYPKCDRDDSNLSPGNFIAYLIACRLVRMVNFVTHPIWNGDLTWPIFHNFDEKSELIEMRRYSREDFVKLIGFYSREDIRLVEPISIEPAVPFKIIDCQDFYNSQPYDYIFLTQSPSFTPASSDRLIPIIMEYINDVSDSF